MRRWVAMLLTTAMAAPAIAQVSALPRRAIQTDSQRLADLLTVIEGQNTLQARRTAARELLRQGSLDTPARLAAILSGSNRPARIAVSQALADSREFLDDRYIEPLVGMLTDTEPESRQAAASALASYGNNAVVQRLERLLSEAETAQLGKLAAIDALGNMSQPAALGVLFGLTSDPTSPLCRPALAALERATAQDFSNDPQKALDWWREAQGKDATAWQQLQIERLVRQSNGLMQRTRELESRLIASIRDAYLRLPEADRPTQLANFLSDSIDVVRILGLEIVQGQLTEGKSPPPETLARCRGLFSAAEPRVRAAAIRTVSALRDKADSDEFRKLLAVESSGEVRVALVSGLGYCGNSETTQTLLPLIASEDAAVAEEAMASLGRLAERGALDGAGRDAAICAILARPTSMLPKTPGGRERELRSLAKFSDARVAKILFASLETTEPTPIRVAAIRGLTALAIATNGSAYDGANASAPSPNRADPTTSPVTLRHTVAEALAPLLTDGDTQVRRSAIDGLSSVADSESHLQALWLRLNPAVESDEALRGQAWKAVLAYLGGRSVKEIQATAERIADTEPVRSQRRLDLELLIEKALIGDPQLREELGTARARIAGLRATLNQVPEAISAYCGALDSLTSTASPELPNVATALLRCALSNERYDAQIAAELKPDRVGLDINSLGEVARTIAEQCLKRGGNAEAAAVLNAFQSTPPAPLPDGLQKELKALLERAKSAQNPPGHDDIQKALSDLRADPSSEAARGTMVRMGRKVLPELRRALLAEINSPQRNPLFESALCELAKSIRPDWPGLPANASIADKIKAAETLEG